MTSIETLMRDSNPMMDPSTEFSEEEIQAFDLLVQSRRGNVDVQELNKPVEPQKKQRSGWLIAAASFAGVIALVGAVTLLMNRTDELAPATTPPTAVAADSAPEPIPTPSEAVAVANTWYAALNAGDVDAVMALFAPDPVLSTNFGGFHTLEEERLTNIWDAAQGTRLETDGCAPAGENSERGQQHVRCIGANYDALVQAVDATPVPAIVTITIGADGIDFLQTTFGSPDFNHVADPFDMWMTVHHPEVEDFGFGSFDTAEEAETSGKLTAQYASEWATYLEANDCTYLDGC